MSSTISNTVKVKQDPDWECPLDLITWRRSMGTVDGEYCVDKEGEKQWQAGLGDAKV